MITDSDKAGSDQAGDTSDKPITIQTAICFSLMVRWTVFGFL